MPIHSRLLVIVLLLSTCNFGSLNAAVTEDQILQSLEQISKNQAFDKAVETAESAVKAEDSMMRSAGLTLFGALVDKGQAVDKAIKVAHNATASTNTQEKKEGLGLFMILAGKGNAFTEATMAAKEALQSTSEKVRAAGLELLQQLVNQSQAFSEAIKAAADGLTKSAREQGEALHLYIALVQKGQALNEALKAAELGFSLAPNNSIFSMMTISHNLFKELFEKGIGFDKAQIIATQLVNTQDRDNKLSGLSLFTDLIQHKKALDAALSAALIALKDKSLMIQGKGFAIVEELINQGTHLDEAQEALQQLLNTKYGEMFGSKIHTALAKIEKAKKSAALARPAANPVKK